MRHAPSPDKEPHEFKEVAMWRTSTEGRFASALRRKSRDLNLNNVEEMKNLYEK